MMDGQQPAQARQQVSGSGHQASGEDSGAVTVFTAILAASLLLMTGLVVDGGRLLRRYVEAHDLAGNAARAAAQAVVRGEPGVSGTGLYGGDRRPAIDQAAAQARVNEFLASASDGSGVGTATVDASDPTRVTVEVTLNQSLIMLPPGSQAVTARASAVAVRGVEAPG